MAEKKKQDEKLILGLGVAVAVGLVAWATLSYLSLESKLNVTNGKRNDLTSLAAEERMGKAAELLNSPPQWNAVDVKGRVLQLFTPIQLFLIPGDPNLIDLGSENEGPVHPPVPNKWWLDHKIDPSYKNALRRDFDGDGFSNLEEFESKTNPADDKEYPELVSKLAVASHSLVKWKVYFTSDIGEGQYQFKYEDSKRNALRSQYIGIGDRFFDKEPVVSRYIVKEILDREEESNGMVRSVKYAVVEDTQKAEKFEIPKSRKNDYLGKDYTVSFVLNALGKEEMPFTLPENTRFNLPDGKVNPEGEFHFVKVNKDNMAIIHHKKGDEISELLIPLK